MNCDLILAHRHAVHAFEYADAAARNAASGFVSADLYKLALQRDDNSLWLLVDLAPTWQAVGGSSGGTGGGVVFSQPATIPVSMSQNDELTLTHPAVTNERVAFSILQQGISQSHTDSTVSFDQADEALYIQEDSNATVFTAGRVELQGTLPADPYTKLLLHCDGSNGSTVLVDSSPSSHVFTEVAAGPVISTAESKFGGASLNFPNGTTGNFQAPYSSDWNMGAGDFTIDFWSKTAATNNMHLIVRGATVPSARWYIKFSPSGQGWSMGGVNGSEEWNTGIITNDDQWHHIAFVRSGSVLTLYVDGVNRASRSISSLIDSSDPLYINEVSGGGCYYGYLDEIRISKGIARWTVGFTPPAAPYDGSPTVDTNTKLLLHCDGSNGSTTLVDSSPAARTVTEMRTGAVISTADSKFGGSSLYFANGTTGYFEVPYSEDWNMGAGNFTFDFWSKTATTANTHLIVRGQETSTVSWYIKFNPSGQGWSLGGVNGSDEWNTGILTNDGQWHHIAFVRSGSALTLYVDGVSRASRSISSLKDSGDPLRINAFNGSGAYIGYLDEFRISKGVARWTGSGFTPPTAPYESATYPAGPAYVTTGDSRRVVLTNWSRIASAAITASEPGGTSIRGLVSFDGRATWKRWNGSAWVAVANGLDDLQPAGNTVAEIEAGLTNLSLAGEPSLDFAFDLATSVSYVTPSLDGITVTLEAAGTSGYEASSIGRIGAAVDFGVRRINATQTLIRKQNAGTANVIPSVVVGS